jgi:hypothetical protein
MTRIAVGGIVGLAAALVFDVAMAGVVVTAPDGGRTSMLTVVGEAARAHAPLAGALVALGYGGVIGALYGWLLRRARLNELSGLMWGALYGVSWGIVSGLVVVPLLRGDLPFSPAATALVAPALFGSIVGHLLYGAVLGIGFSIATGHVFERHAT